LKQAGAAINTGHEEEAMPVLQLIREMTMEGLIFQKATEMMAVLLAEQGKEQEALYLILPIEKKASPDALNLAHELAFNLRKWQSVSDLGNHTYQLFPNYEVAARNAMAYVGLNQVRPAPGWLQRAQHDGVPNFQALINRTEFDPLRHDFSFQQWLSTLNR
jgi:hypothetical protein